MCRIGPPYLLDLDAHPGCGRKLDVAVPAIATGEKLTPLPQPEKLGLDPVQMVALEPMMISQPSGKRTVKIAVSNGPWPAGKRLLSQAAVPDPAGPAHLTNVNGDTILR